MSGRANNYRRRLQANAALARSEGASLVEVIADVVAVSRHSGPPSVEDLRVATSMVDTLHLEASSAGDVHG